MQVKYIICLFVIFTIGLICTKAKAGFSYPPIGPSNMIPGVSANVGGSALLAGGCTVSTINMPGVVTGMSVVATPVTNPGFGIFWEAWVSAVDTVSIKVCAAVIGTPVSTVYNIRALY